MDGEAVYAHYALHRFKMLPSVFLELGRKEKAFVIASIQVQVEKEKKDAAKIKK